MELQASVDWVTCTATKQKSRKQLYEQFKLDLERMRAAGAVPKRWAWRGYAGLQIAGLRWGTRHDSDIVVASGAITTAVYRDYIICSNNVTRVDLCVTYSFEQQMCDLLRVYRDNLFSKSQLRSTFIQNSRHGQTLYVGSRKSRACGRVYDKGIESGLAARGLIWRFEVEHKAEYAKQVAEQIIVDDDNLAALIINHVFRWFNERGVPPPWSKRDNSGVIETHTKIVDDDIGRTLMWLQQQVAPAVRRAIVSRGRQEVIELLGLNECDPSRYSPSI